MSDDREQRLRAHAYWIWEEEGRPDGRHADHWEAANAALAGDEAIAETRPMDGPAQQTSTSAPITPKPRPAVKKPRTRKPPA